MKKLGTAILITAVCVAICTVALFAVRRTVVNIDTVSPTPATREVNIGHFNAVEVSRVNLVITPGQSNGMLRLEAPDNIIQYIKVTNDQGTLKLSLDDNVRCNHSNIAATAYVTTPFVADIEAALASSVRIAGPMTISADAEFEVSTAATIIAGDLRVSGDCELEAYTGGTITIDRLVATGFDAESYTAGVINVKDGTLRRVELEAYTGGTIDILGLSFTSGTATAATGGTVRCNTANLTSSNATTGGAITSR